MESDYLILRRASAFRPSGECNDDDYDVLCNGVVIGRIMQAAAVPVGMSWMWTLAFGHHEDRTQYLHAGGLDVVDMHKNIGAAVIGSDKAISAICVEEFDPPTRHCSLNPIPRTASAPTRLVERRISPNHYNAVLATLFPRCGKPSPPFPTVEPARHRWVCQSGQ